MAFGLTEDPGINPSEQLDSVEYPVWREQLVKSAADNDGSPDVINLFKCLPKTRYDSKTEILRDFAEAARRLASGYPGAEDDGINRDRQNIGRDAVENAKEGHTRHP
jgi:hypothetical protein